MSPPLYPQARQLITATGLPGMVGVCVTVLLAIIAWFDPAVLVRFDDAALDAQFRVRGERDPGQEIVLVLFDEKSLTEVGRWPWSRDLQARLLDRLTAAAPKVIGLDVIYAETEAVGAGYRLKPLLQNLQDRGLLSPESMAVLGPQLNVEPPDHQLAVSIGSAGNVVLAVPFFVPERNASAGESGVSRSDSKWLSGREFMVVRQAGVQDGFRPYVAATTLAPIHALAKSAKALGHVYRLPDHDGVTRREVLALDYGGNYYPSFALEIARLYLDVPREHMALSLGEGVLVGSWLFSTDQKLRAVINYAGRDRRFPWVSATDVLHDRVAPEVLRGKAVLVGTAALGTYDQLSTPFSANYPGVEKNATVVENILHQGFLTGGYWRGVMELMLVLGFGLLCAILLPRFRAIHGMVFALVFVGSYLGIAQYLFSVMRISLPLVMPLVTIGTVFSGTTVLSYALRERQAREVRAMFASYVSPKIVQELMTAPSKARLGGERKELTMLFADLVGFTSFSEKRPAEEVVAQLNEYLGAMTEVIFKWSGTLDKFVGDEIVVFWGAPLDQPDHVELGVRCALEMRHRLKALQDRWIRQGKPVLENGIGINTGTVVVGNIGAEGKKMDYTVIGDHVNLAARFQGLTRTLGHSILLTEYTAARLEGVLALRNKQRQGTLLRLSKVQVVSVRGRNESVAAYTVEAADEEMPQAMAS